jgi:hypothetical protein
LSATMSRGGGVGRVWAGSECGGGGPLRCKKVVGERDEGGPADFGKLG